MARDEWHIYLVGSERYKHSQITKFSSSCYWRVTLWPNKEGKLEAAEGNLTLEVRIEGYVNGDPVRRWVYSANRR